MPTISNIIDRIAGRRRESEAAITDDLRTTIVRIGCDQLGVPCPVKGTLNLEYAADLVEAADFSQTDVEFNVDRFITRHKDALTIAGEDQIVAALEDVSRQIIEEDQAEGAHRRAWDSKQAARIERQRVLQVQRDECMEARTRMLSTADTTPEERAANAENDRLVARIRELDAKLVPHRPMAERQPNTWPNGNEYPLALLNATRAYLAQDNALPENKGAGIFIEPERRIELQGNVKGLERRVAELQKERAKLDKAREENSAKWRTFNAAKLQPQNLRLEKKSPTLDEHLKQRARSLGMMTNA